MKNSGSAQRAVTSHAHLYVEVWIAYLGILYIYIYICSFDVSDWIIWRGKHLHYWGRAVDGSDRIIWREKAVTLLRKAVYILWCEWRNNLEGEGFYTTKEGSLSFHSPFLCTDRLLWVLMHVAATEELSKVKKAYEKDTKLYLAREEEEKRLQRKIQVRQKVANRILCTELYGPSPSSQAFHLTSWYCVDW